MLYGLSFPMSQEAMSDNFLLPIGKAKVEREGGDITIVAHSKMVSHSLEAAEELAKEGIKAEVINLRSIRPLDIGTIIKSVKKTNRLETSYLPQHQYLKFYVECTDLSQLKVASLCLVLEVRFAPRLSRAKHSTTLMPPSNE
jgi:pyruvate/2-oxoacid:ferredoxin oxidoreductase alpha subunit